MNLNRWAYIIFIIDLLLLFCERIELHSFYPFKWKKKKKSFPFISFLLQLFTMYFLWNALLLNCCRFGEIHCCPILYKMPKTITDYVVQNHLLFEIRFYALKFFGCGQMVNFNSIFFQFYCYVWTVWTHIEGGIQVLPNFSMMILII